MKLEKMIFFTVLVLIICVVVVREVKPLYEKAPDSRIMYPSSGMKVIFLFDSDKLDNCYRYYSLSDTIVKSLREGKEVTLTFCHPAYGEVMMAKVRN